LLEWLTMVAKLVSPAGYFLSNSLVVVVEAYSVEMPIFTFMRFRVNGKDMIVRFSWPCT